jgi:hypothetical protein
MRRGMRFLRRPGKHRRRSNGGKLKVSQAAVPSSLRGTSVPLAVVTAAAMCSFEQAARAIFALTASRVLSRRCRAV